MKPIHVTLICIQVHTKLKWTRIHQEEHDAEQMRPSLLRHQTWIILMDNGMLLKKEAF